MDKMIAYCGLSCHTCPIYLATRENDQTKKKRMRAEIAQQCAKLYGTEYKPEDINDCDGCRTESGRLFSESRGCRIRGCAAGKGIENCGYCSEYVCKQLLKLFAMEPEAKKRLDQIKSKRQ